MESITRMKCVSLCKQNRARTWLLILQECRTSKKKGSEFFGCLTKASSGDSKQWWSLAISKRASANEPVNLSTCRHGAADWPVKSSMKLCVTSLWTSSISRCSVFPFLVKTSTCREIKTPETLNSKSKLHLPNCEPADRRASFCIIW